MGGPGTRRAIVAALVTLAASAAIASEADSLTYRVAGTIAIDANRAVAMIESSDGDQQLYRLGEQIEGWEIAGIDSDNVTLDRGGQVIRLPLQGKLRRLEPVEEVLDELPATSAASTTIDFNRASERLRLLERRPAEGMPDAVTYGEINEALGLTPATRIREVDGTRAHSPQEVVQLSIVALTADMPFRLAVADNRVDEIYLVPSEN